MSNIDIFFARGAQSVAGSIILRGKTLGTLRNGDLILTEDGLAELEIEEVVAKPTAPKAEKAPKAAKAAAKTPTTKPAEEPVSAPQTAALGDVDLDLDEFLDDVA